MRGIDEADLVLIGAVALDTNPDELVGQVDVDVLAALSERTAMAPGPVEAAAEVLVGIAAGRPFPIGNLSVAWLAAAHLLALNALGLTISDDDARSLVRRAAIGEADEAATRVALRSCLVKRDGMVRRGLRWLATPSRVTPQPASPMWICPVCFRSVEHPLGSPGPRQAVGSPTTCRAGSHQHHAHERDGIVGRRTGAPDDSAECWLPVVRPDEPASDDCFVVLAPPGAVAFMAIPALTGDTGSGNPRYELIMLADLRPTDLLGSWDNLPARGSVVGPVDRHAIRFDPREKSVDWHHLLRSAAHLADRLSDSMMSKTSGSGSGA